MSYGGLTKGQEKDLLDGIKKSVRAGELIENIDDICKRFKESANGDRPTHNQITNALYDIAKLEPEKQSLAIQSLTQAGILKRNVIEKRLKEIRMEINPSEDTKSSTTQKPIYCGKFESLVDLVDNDGRVAFLVKEPDGSLKVLDSIERDGKKLLPPPKEQLPYRLPAWENVRLAYLEHDPGKLFGDLVSYHHKISKLPSESHLILLAAWDFSTYIQEQLPYSGYLCFFNVAGRGKTRTGMGLVNVAYRGIHTITLRESNLFRFSHNLGASLFFDVMDLSRKLEKCDSEDILLQRFQRGARVSRVQNPEEGPFKDTVYYDVFGPTIIATNTALDKILDTRCFAISMPHSSKHYPDADPLEGLALRERLVAWRAKRLFEPLRDCGKVMSGRLGDISMPLRAILQEVKPEAISTFDDLVEQMQESSRGDRSESLEGRILQTVKILLPQAYGEKLSLPTIAAKLNENIPEDSKAFINPYKLGHTLKSLGFKKDRSSTERFIWVDIEQLESMCQEYGIELPGESSGKTSQTSHCHTSDEESK